VDYYADQLTRADLWALASLHAADVAQQDQEDAVDYPFDYYGRVTCDDIATAGPVDNLPSAHQTTEKLLQYFKAEFDYTAQETVAIMGGHTLGTLAEENSGFDGPQGWVRDPNRLDNDFYIRLLQAGNFDEPNSRYRQESGDNGEVLWRYQIGQQDIDIDNIEAVVDDIPTVMLNADFALVVNFEFSTFEGGVNCIPGRALVFDNSTNTTTTLDDGAVICEAASTLNQVTIYANDNALWLQDFRDAFVKMTFKGHSLCDLTHVDGPEAAPALEGCSSSTSVSTISILFPSMDSSFTVLSPTSSHPRYSRVLRIGSRDHRFGIS
jgi:hypothetical protein